MVARERIMRNEISHEIQYDITRTLADKYMQQDDLTTVDKLDLY